MLVAPFTLFALPLYGVSLPEDNRNVFITASGLVIYVVWFSMFMSTLIFFMSQSYQGKLQPIKANIINGLIYAPLVILTLLIANSPFLIAAIIAFNSTSLSFLVFPFIILGIYVSLKSSFAPFHLMLEGYKPLGALKCSFMSTSGKVGKIIVVLLAFYFITSIIDVLTTINTNSKPINLLLYFVGVAATMLLVAFQQIAVFKLYINSFEDS